MGKSRVIAMLLLAGCQGLYVGKSEPLKRPPSVPRPAGATTADDPVYVEDCEVDFSSAATKPRQTRPAERKLAVADAELAQVSGTPDDQTKVAHVRSAIETYGEALRVDPYNAAATVKLALAYDRVLRKGCALALVKRLAIMADHPKLEAEAKPQVGLIVANPHWFRGYRNDVLRALGY
jgi:hypothetical protein